MLGGPDFLMQKNALRNNAILHKNTKHNCKKCTHCGQLIFRKISKIGATRFCGQNASNSISNGALPQTPLWELTVHPRPPAVFKGPTSKSREGKGKEMEKRGRDGGSEL